MARYREKKDPRQIANWLAMLAMEPGDELLLQAFAGHNSIGADTVCRWAGNALAVGDVALWSSNILTLAQDHCDLADQRGAYRLAHMRGSDLMVSFTIKLLPAEAGASADDDEDASLSGFARQLMAQNRQLHNQVQASQQMALESLAKQLDMSNERLWFLEAERSKNLDLYHQSVENLAEAEAAQTPKPTVVEQVERALPLLPQAIQAVRLLTSVVKV